MNGVDREQWNLMTVRERIEYAHNLGRQISHEVSFVGLKQDSKVASFECDEVEFVFVPGGNVSIGFDASEWEPTEEEIESWEDTAEEYQLDLNPMIHLLRIMNRDRSIRMPSLLVEATAREFGWRLISSSDPLVVEILKRYDTVTSYHGDKVIRVRRDEDNQIIAEQQIEITHKEVVELLGSDGFRLSTSDEWEYLCSAGKKTLFRWGDHVPCDRYPTDLRPKKGKWSRSDRTQDKEFEAEWDHHTISNALGLTIASNPYEMELVAEPHILRGGDGGCSICGGIGFFAGWLPLASAYFEKEFCTRDANEPIDPGFTFVRRVIEIE